MLGAMAGATGTAITGGADAVGMTALAADLPRSD
jgi:hypothetical protein